MLETNSPSTRFKALKSLLIGVGIPLALLMTPCTKAADLPLVLSPVLPNTVQIMRVRQIALPTVGEKRFVKIQGRDEWFLESKNRLFQVVPDRISIKLRPGVADDAISTLGTPLRKSRLGVLSYEIPQGADPVQFLQELLDAHREIIHSATLNTLGKYEDVFPDDLDVDNQWNLNNTGQEIDGVTGLEDADIDAPEAWEFSTGTQDVIVAVTDSGTDIDHEDLSCNIWVNLGEDADNNGVIDSDDENDFDDDGNGYVDDFYGWDFGNNNNDVASTNSHGTYVAGIVGACSNNGIGIAGIAGGDAAASEPGARLMILAVGEGAPSSAAVAEAVEYATNNGAHIITLSLSIGDENPGGLTYDALTDAHTSGLFINNASGNNSAGRVVGYPATHPDVMAVGATDNNDERPGFANFGPELEVAAPGDNVYSTDIDGYGFNSGTSFASPHVAGTAALMFSATDFIATNEQIRDCIVETADWVSGMVDGELDPVDFHNEYGNGRLNAASALGCIIAMTINLPPECDANGPYIAECGVTSLVTLDGTGSFDPNGDPLTFVWSGPFEGGTVAGSTPLVNFFIKPTTDEEVDLLVDDGRGASASCSAVVNVVDTLAPVLAAPGLVVEECTSPDGTPVNLGMPTVSDLCDSDPTVVNDAPGLFPLGETTVGWTATDSSGNVATDNQSITVVDTLAPVLTAPDPVVKECTSPVGTHVALGTPAVLDQCDSDPTFVNDAPGLFPLGETIVGWTATDSRGNVATDNQSITVVDTTSPVINCNAPATIVPPDAPISFIATVEDSCDDTVAAVITDYDCFSYTKKGKRIDKTDSCQVSFSGNTITILDSGGIDDIITWNIEATDASGNTGMSSCEVMVVKKK